MRKSPFLRFTPALLGGALVLAALSVNAQGGPGGGGPPLPVITDPRVTAVAPAYNAPAAAAASDVQITFRKPVVLAGGSPMFVWGDQTGRRSGTLTGSGTRQIRFSPTQNWRPGEEVKVMYNTTPATLDQAQPTMALGSALAYYFRGATAPAAGPLTAVATPPTTGLSARQVEVADLDGDGDSDLVIVGTQSGGAGRVAVLRLDAAGYTPIASLVTSATASMVLGDLTGDGLAELLVSDAASPAATVTVYRNPGTGIFAAGAGSSTTVSVGPGAYGMRVTDRNLDGTLDLITVNTNGTVSQRINDGTGTLITDVFPTTTITGVRAVLPTNVVNGGPEASFVGTTNAVRYFFNDGGSFAASGLFLATGIAPVNNLAAGDFNGDSLTDVLIATTSGLLIARNTFSGYQLSTLLNGASCPMAHPADVDGDGDLDILVPATAANGVQVLRNDGTGAFTAETPLPLNVPGSQPAWVAAADLNGDGTLDAVTANGLLANSATVLLNTAPDGNRNAVVSTPKLLAGSYDNVTVTGTGTLVLGADLSIEGTLTVQSGGTLKLAGYRLLGSGAVVVQAGATVEVASPAGLSASGATGDVQTTGARTFSSGARYVFRGTDVQQSGAGLPSTVLDLVVNNTQGLTLTAPVAVTRAVLLTDGNLVSNGNLTLLSSAAGTAQVINTNGIVTGSATMQRYIRGSANPRVGYHHLSTPVSSTTIADLTTAGFAPRVSALYNTAPASVPASQYPNIFSYEESRLTGSGATAAFDRGWMSPTATSNPMVSGKGYSVYISPSSKPDFTGTLTNGPVPSGPLTRGSTPESGWQLLGNPYPSPLNWDSVAQVMPATMSKQVSVFRSTGANSGVYVTRLNGVSSADPAGVLADGWIGPMQGFFTRVLTPGTTSFTFTNGARAKTIQAAPAYRTAAPTQVRLSATAATDAAQADYTTVYCAPGATTGLEPAADAWKQRSVGAPSVFTLATGTTDELAINAIAPLTGADVVVPVGLDVPTAGTYYLAASATNLPAGWRVLLEDALTATAYDLTQAAPYALTLPAGTLTTNRLRLRFTTSANSVTGLGAATGIAPLALTLSPNPTRETVRLNLSGNAPDNATITVLDARGTIVRTQALGAGRTEATLALGNLPAGVYLVRVGSLTQRLAVQ